MNLPFGLKLNWSLRAGERHLLVWAGLTRPARMLGIANRVLDAKGNLLGHVMFADVDSVDHIGVIEERLATASRHIDFGDAFIFRSGRRNWHVIAPKVLDADAQVAFNYYLHGGHSVGKFARDREMTLRYSPKRGKPPEFVERFHGLGRAGIYSAPHLDALKRLYRVPARELAEYRTIGACWDRKTYGAFNW